MLARQLYDAAVPLGTQVNTSRGLRYLSVSKRGRPLLSQTRNKKGVPWFNCYAYAFDDYAINYARDPRPGEKSGFVYRNITCRNVVKAVLMDHPGWRYAGCKYSNLRVSKNADIVYLVVSADDDYHFYKRRRGVWTHKPGSTPISSVDASGRRIRNPDTADHRYPDTDYSFVCGYFVRR